MNAIPARLTDAIDTLLLQQEEIQGACSFRTFSAIAELRAAYASATHDPCKLHRTGHVCHRCPFDPVCND